MNIPVRPKNYRRIALAAIARATDPVVLTNGERVSDYSTSGPVTQKGIGSCRNFEVRDGATPILGFHDHPDEMWIAAAYQDLAEHCAREGWLKIQGVPPPDNEQGEDREILSRVRQLVDGTVLADI